MVRSKTSKPVKPEVKDFLSLFRLLHSPSMDERLRCFQINLFFQADVDKTFPSATVFFKLFNSLFGLCFL